MSQKRAREDDPDEHFAVNPSEDAVSVDMSSGYDPASSPLHVSGSSSPGKQSYILFNYN